MIELGAAPFSISEEELLDKHGNELAQMIRDDLDSDVESERLTQVAYALRNLMYWQSKQYVVPRYDSNSRTVEFVQASDKAGKVKFSSVYNIFESDGVKFIGAVSPRAPNAKALPDDDESERDMSAARDIDGILRMLRRKWDSNRKQKELAYHAWVTGPTFGHVSYVSDGHTYGWTEEPVIDTEEVDVGFGETIPIPKMEGTKKYPKGDVELNLYSVLYVTIPYKAKTIKQAPWLRLEYMEHKSVLKGLYKKLTDEKYERSTVSTAGQQEAVRAQYQESSPSGRTGEEWGKNRWHYARYWLRPSMFCLIKGEVAGVDDDGSTKKRRLSDVLEDQFPDGLRIALVNGEVVEVAHERMDDVWSVCKTGKGDRILSEPWGNNLVPIQDDLNDFFNMAKEIILRSIPKTFVDASLIDQKTIEDNDPEIAEVIRVKMQAGMPMAQRMAEMPLSRMPDQLIPFAGFMRNVSREVGQVNEALSGGGAPAPTYRGEKMRRDQSMMAFAPFFDETQAFWESAYTNGIRQLAKYGSGSIKVPGEDGKGAIQIDPAMIPDYGWHIEAEEGLPMSHAEEVDRFLFLLNENNPEAIAKLGLLSPTNSSQVHKMLGLRGFKAPEELARQKALYDINKLLAEPGIPDIDPMTGEQIGLMPSIPPDKFDDPVLFTGIYAEWLLASAAFDGEKNVDGFANVVARWEAYKRLADQMMMPPPGEAGPPPPPEEPPPPMPAAPPREPLPFDTGGPGIPIGAPPVDAPLM